jgi:hypothetical protein
MVILVIILDDQGKSIPADNPNLFSDRDALLAPGRP